MTLKILELATPNSAHFLFVNLVELGAMISVISAKFTGWCFVCLKYIDFWDTQLFVKIVNIHMERALQQTWEWCLSPLELGEDARLVMPWVVPKIMRWSRLTEPLMKAMLATECCVVWAGKKDWYLPSPFCFLYLFLHKSEPWHASFGFLKRSSLSIDCLHSFWHDTRL